MEMRLHILSDLHIDGLVDFHNYHLDDVGADVLILAGDIAEGAAGIWWAAEQASRLSIPVVYVPGNHEYYYRDMQGGKQLMKRIAAKEGVHFLDNKSVVIGDVRFLGSTLWTDFSAWTDRAEAMSVASQRMNDHRVIGLNGRRFLPGDAAALHTESVSWLQKQLVNTPFNGKTVVVTHHAPTPAAQHPAFPLNELSAAFWTDLESLIAYADLWIYGHTHACLDQIIEGTRVVSNQGGYRRSFREPGEDPRFDPKFVVEIQL